MPTLKLTTRSVNALKPRPDGSRVYYWDKELTGFGVIVGKTGLSYIVQARVKEKGRTVREARCKIGKHGAIGDLGEWTLPRARTRAKELLGAMANGVDLNRAKDAKASDQITLRDGLDLHVANMKKNNRSPRSIHSIETEVPRLLSKLIDRPLMNLSGLDLDAICQKLLADTPARAGSANAPGAALSNRLIAHVSAIWNAVDRLHELPGRNPAKKVTGHSLSPRKNRIAPEEFGEWLKTVRKRLSPVRRDLQLFTLFTGLRSESVRSIRWEDIDFSKSVLYVRITKGDKPYTIPLSATCLEILGGRKTENTELFEKWGGDAGWVFPALSRSAPHQVQPVAEPKEYRVDEVTKKREQLIPGLHTLRKTYNSVAMEIGIARHDREALMNHQGQGVNAKHYGFPQDWTHLAECQSRIEAALWQRLVPSSIIEGTTESAAESQ